MRSTETGRRSRTALLLAIVSTAAIGATFFTAAARAEFNTADTSVASALSAGSYSARASNGISRYQNSIARLEKESGVYAPELFQELLGLGRLQYNAGQYQSALATLQRAAQISRINQGLYSEDQLSLTRLVVDTLRAAGHMDEVAPQLERLVSLSSRYYGQQDVRTAAALNELGEWKLAAYLNSLGKHQDTYLVESAHSTAMHPDYETFSPALAGLYEAQELFLKAIRVMVEGAAYTDPTLYAAEGNLLQTYYLNANRENMLQNGLSWQAAAATQDAAEFRKLPDDYHKGLDSYRRQLGYMRSKPGTTFGELADTMLAMADWHQLFNRSQQAATQRQKLKQLLENAGLSAGEVSDLMHEREAVALPVFMSAPFAISLSGTDSSQVVEVAIMQNGSGRVVDARIASAPEALPAALQDRLLEQVRNTRFRMQDAGTETSTLRVYFH